MGMDCLARWWSHIPGGVFEDGHSTPYSGQVDKVVFGLRADLISEVFSNLIGFVVEEVVKWKRHHFSLDVMGSLSLHQVFYILVLVRITDTTFGECGSSKLWLS